MNWFPVSMLPTKDESKRLVCVSLMNATSIGSYLPPEKCCHALRRPAVMTTRMWFRIMSWFGVSKRIEELIIVIGWLRVSTSVHSRAYLSRGVLCRRSFWTSKVLNLTTPTRRLQHLQAAHCPGRAASAGKPTFTAHWSSKYPGFLRTVLLKQLPLQGTPLMQADTLQIGWVIICKL